MKDKAKVKMLAKFAVKASLMMFTGIAASVTTAAIIKNIIPMDNLTKINKALIVVGGGAIGGVVGNAGADYAGKVFDETLFMGEEYYKFINGLFSNPPKEENEEVVPV